MIVFSCVDLKPRLAGFKCDSKPYSCTKHHLRTRHEIIHAIFKCWQKRLFINQVKVNFLICRNLDSYVSSNEINIASQVFKLMVVGPVACFTVNLEE